MAVEERNEAGQDAARSGRRRFVVGVAAAAPVVMTLASKPAKAYECTHSALMSGGRGSAKISKRRNPRACYNEEVQVIKNYYEPRIADAHNDAHYYANNNRPDEAQKAEERAQHLAWKLDGEISQLQGRYSAYPNW